jgi:hypothetical protein
MTPIRNLQCPPVLLLVFNRPNLTEQVFRQIRKAQPSQLFVAADGPREDHPEDRSLCQEAREVATQVDWECEVHTLFRGENLGTRKAISSAVSWFFDHVDAGIILEDDCLPAGSFFPFCRSLLEKYHYDERIVMISGYNPLTPWRSNEQSYHFSNYGGIWGWATWGDQWSAYHEARKIDDVMAIERVLNNVLVEPEQVVQRTQSISRVFDGEFDSWGYQWFWARVLQNKLSVVPAYNLVSNIGFGEGASRTTNPDDPRANLPLEDVSFPLSPPNGTYPDREYDAEWFQVTHGSNATDSNWERLKILAKDVASNFFI